MIKKFIFSIHSNESDIDILFNSFRGYKHKGVNIAKKQPVRGITKARKIKVKGGGKKIGKKKSLPVSREALDREIDSFMKSRVTES